LTTWPRVPRFTISGTEEVAAVDHAEEVHARDPLPVFEAGLEKERAHADAGVVDEEIDGAVLAMHQLGEGSHLGP
jgi:hypothetical protein